MFIVTEYAALKKNLGFIIQGSQVVKSLLHLKYDSLIGPIMSLVLYYKTIL